MSTILTHIVDDLGERDPENGVSEEYSLRHVPRVGEYIKLDNDWKRYHVLEVVYELSNPRKVTLKVKWEPEPLL